MDHLEEVANFKKRVFSGYDVLMLMDEIGVGVGSTMHIVREHELRREKHPDIYRAFTYQGDVMPLTRPDEWDKVKIEPVDQDSDIINYTISTGPLEIITPQYPVQTKLKLTGYRDDGRTMIEAEVYLAGPITITTNR